MRRSIERTNTNGCLDLQARPEMRMKQDLGKMPDDAPFSPAPDWTVRRPDGLTEAGVRAAKPMKLDVSLHSLRHTHASQLIASNLDIQQGCIQRRF